MKLSWKIGTVFGIPVKLHITMLLLPLLTYGRMPVDGSLGIVAWLALVVLLFGSVLLHELGHALTARRYGVQTRDIILTPIGGMARIVTMPKTPKHEIAIAIAGPLVSLVLAGLAMAASVPLAFIHVLPSVVYEALGLFIWINLILGLFNLVPALPMDGGRILRGFLAMNRDHLTATRIAAKVGRVLAVAGGILALFWLNSWSLALISGFIYMSAGSELRVAEWAAYQQKRAKRSPFGPYGDNREQDGGGFWPGGGMRTWTWSWPPEGPAGRTERDPLSEDFRASYWDAGRHPTEAEHEQTEDWTRQSQGREREVIVVEGGKAEVIARRDPPKDDDR